MAKNNSLGFLLRFDSNDVHKSLKNLRTDFGDFKKVASETGDTIRTAFQTTSLIGFAIALKNITQTMLKASKAETEYIENMNLLQNAYDGNIESAQKLINTMSEFYGLDASGVTRQLGTYRQMSSALGITADKANLLSENMIKLQEDVSSLYNISNQMANSKLTSALTGQTKPIRALGADITEASLQQELYNRGIDKSVKEMNRASKTILIYLAMERQLINANGDASRTINSVANQSRIFTEQLAVAGRQIGAVFIPVLRTLLPILNGILMALNAIGELILGLLGIDVGKLAKEFGIGTSSIDMGLDDIGESAGNASKKVKELQLGLRAFDKLNVIKTPTESKSGTGAGVGLGAVDSDVLNALKEYNLQLDETRNKALKVRDAIMEWLGFTKEVDSETGKVSFKFDHITGGTVLGALAVTGTIGIGALRLYKILDKIGLIKFVGIKDVGKIFASLSKLIAGASASTIALTGAITALVAMFVVAYNKNEDLRKSISNIGKNYIEIAQNIKELIANIVEFGHSIDKYMKPLVELVFSPLIIAVKELYYWWELTFKQMSITLETWTTVVSKLLKGDLSGAFKAVKTGLSELWKNWKEYWGKLKERVVEKIKEIKENIDEMPEKISAVVKKIFDKLIEKVTETNWIEVGQKIVKLIGDGFENVGEITSKLVKNIFNGIKDKCTTNNGEIDWIGLGKTILNTLLTVLIIANPLIMWGKIAIQIVTGIVKGIVESLTSEENKAKIKDAFKKLFEKASNGAIEAINKLIEKLEAKLTEIKDAMEKVKNIDVKKSAKNVITTVIGKIKLFDGGGFPDKGDAFIMNENKPEFLGSINGRTAVANNDQIVEAISIGVAKAMSASGNKPVIIEAKGDTQGLLDFIQFKQQQKDRQFGL